MSDPCTLVHLLPMLSCARAASTARVGSSIASQTASDLASKSHFTICFLPLLSPTIAGWILHGANSEMKTSLQKVSKWVQLWGEWKEAKLRKKLSCKAVPIKPQLTFQEALNLWWPFEWLQVQGRGLTFICPHQPVIGYRLPWEEGVALDKVILFSRG